MAKEWEFIRIKFIREISLKAYSLMDFITKRTGDIMALMMKKEEKYFIIESTLMEFIKKGLMRMGKRLGNGLKSVSMEL